MSGFIHATATVDPGASVGDGTKVWINVQIREGARIGANCVISKDVYIDHGVMIGDGCKIQNSVSVFHGVTLEDEVFVGPNACFTNDKVPRAFVQDWAVSRTLVRRGASIGANATIVCGHTLGAWCLIAAGAVVTHDVPPLALMAGVPARRVGWVSHAGEVLGEDLVCPRTGDRYAERSGALRRVINLSGFGDDPPDASSEEPSASVG